MSDLGSKGFFRCNSEILFFILVFLILCFGCGSGSTCIRDE